VKGTNKSKDEASLKTCSRLFVPTTLLGKPLGNGICKERRILPT